MNDQYSVLIMDNFHHADSEHEYEVSGFNDLGVATEYARRRVRSSIEEFRPRCKSKAELREMWGAFGEGAVVLSDGKSTVPDLDYFIDNPASGNEIDWKALEPGIRVDAKEKHNKLYPLIIRKNKHLLKWVAGFAIFSMLGGIWQTHGERKLLASFVEASVASGLYLITVIAGYGIAFISGRAIYAKVKNMPVAWVIGIVTFLIVSVGLMLLFREIPGVGSRYMRMFS